MHAPATTHSSGALCVSSDASPAGAAPETTATGDPVPSQPLFPPKDADAQARRRWLATSPWPEVVFASAGA